MDLLRKPKSHGDTFKLHNKYKYMKRSKHVFDGETYLMWLMKNTSVYKVWDYLKVCSTSELRAVDNNGRNALMYACIYCKSAVRSILNLDKINVNDCDNNGASAFSYACKQCSYDIIRTMIHSTSHIDRAVEIACDCNRVYVLCILLQKNYPITSQDFAYACAKSNLKVVNTLFKYYKDTDYKCMGITMLSWAALNPNVDVVEFLLSEQFDDKTSLHVACAQNNSKVIKVLFDKYSDYLTEEDVNKLFNRGMLSILMYIYGKLDQDNTLLLKVYDANAEKLKMYHEDVCPICLDGDDEKWIWLKCGHCFHLECICKYEGEKCPLCRVEF